MKDARTIDIGEPGSNPLDVYERFLKSRKARFKRIDSDSLAVDVEGYTIELFWSEEEEALMCTCFFGPALPEAVRDLAAPVILHINRRQFLGYFGISEDGFACWRHTVLFHGNTGSADSEVIEEITDIALRNCDQYETAFTLMAEANTPEDFPRLFDNEGGCAPLGLALIDTAGQS